MNLLIMGAAGSGKGTISGAIVKRYGIPHISTGEMFRDAISQQMPLGLEAKMYMDKGMLVPDVLTIAMVKRRLQQEDCQKGYLLDGYPRTLDQAKALEKIAQEINRPLQKVLNLVVSKATLIDRITGRRVCPVDGSVYHIRNRPPKTDGICDLCGAPLVQRSDDTLERLEVRLKAHDTQTVPCIEYYRSEGLVVDFDGERTAEIVAAEVFAALEMIR